MYMKEMSMDTEQKLADTHEMRLPRVVELMDMSETTHQKVSKKSCFIDTIHARFSIYIEHLFYCRLYRSRSKLIFS